MKTAFGAISGRREANSTSVEISPIPISDVWLAVPVMASAEPFDRTEAASTRPCAPVGQPERILGTRDPFPPYGKYRPEPHVRARRAQATSRRIPTYVAYWKGSFGFARQSGHDCAHRSVDRSDPCPTGICSRRRGYREHGVGWRRARR